MTEYELELIRIIREHNNQEQAMLEATAIILGFLARHESSEEQAAAYLPALD